MRSERLTTTNIEQPLILVVGDELDKFVGLLPDNVEVFGIAEVSKDRIDVVSSSGRRTSMTTAPMLCLALLAIKPSSLAILDRAREVFQGWAAHDFPSSQLISSETLSNQLALLLSTSLLDKVRVYAANVTRLSRELFRLRAVHEDTLNAFSAVEAFVAASNIQPCNLSFENDPSGVVFRGEGGVTTIFQTLPVSSLGLSIIQIHINDSEEVSHGIGEITAELRTVEDHSIHQTWQMPGEALTEGWLTLPLRQALVGPQRTPLLILSVVGGVGVLPPLSLGSPQALAGFRLRDVDGVALADRSLAIRTWLGVPGIRPAAIDIAGNTMFEQSESAVTDVPIPVQMFRTATFVPNGWEPDFNPVSFLADLRGLECHPPPTGVTWAALPNFPTGREPFRVDAQAAARHPDAAEIEFALAFMDEAPISGDFSIGAIPFSGWRVAPFGAPVLLSVVVENPAGKPGCLVLGARMKDGASNNFAWNCFSGLRKVVLRGTGDTVQGAGRTGVRSPAGLDTPLIMIDGVSVPLSMLEAASDAVPSGLDGSPAIGYDPDRRGILCHPPASGISLARVSTVSVSNGSRVSARAHVGNDLSGAVEFCLVISSVSAEGVIKQLEAGYPIDTASFAWSGWHEVTYAEDVIVHADAPNLESRAESIYLATRMADTARTNDFAWAYFLDLRLTSGES